jgi:hypothetical protein
VSHYTAVATRFRRTEELIEALRSLGLQPEVHDTPQKLRGGVFGAKGARILVRRETLDPVPTSDVGFEPTASGFIEIRMDADDTAQYGPNSPWMGRIAQAYAYRLARRMLGEKGFTVVSEEQDDEGRIRLQLTSG